MTAPAASDRLRVLLDTNIWSYVADQSGADDLEAIARSQGLEIVVCPAIVHEQLRNPKAEVRQRQLEITTSTRWTRMMPEVFIECAEFIEAVKRHRPAWMQTAPTRRAVGDYEIQRWFWQNDFWDRARKRPDDEFAMEVRLAGDRPEILRAQIAERREEFDDAGIKLSNLKLDTPSLAWETFTMAPGVERTMESWRYHGAAFLLSELVDNGHTAESYWTWLAPFFDLQNVMGPDDWFDFWDTIGPTEMPSEWILWATEILEPLTKQNESSIYDMQLLNHIAEVDRFVSADVRLVRMVGRIAAAAPFPVPGGTLATDLSWREVINSLVSID